jgi:hypothetical protein
LFFQEVWVFMWIRDVSILSDKFIGVRFQSYPIMILLAFVDAVFTFSVSCMVLLSCLFYFSEWLEVCQWYWLFKELVFLVIVLSGSFCCVLFLVFMTQFLCTYPRLPLNSPGSLGWPWAFDHLASDSRVLGLQMPNLPWFFL